MRVSIVIPTFNRASLLETAITSALEQDYLDLEVIVSDNASTDDTHEIVRKFLGEPRLKYFRNDENIGMVRNWHKAVFENATGDWFMLLSDDDILTNKSFVSQAIRIVKKDPAVNVVYSNSYIYDQGQNTVTKLELPFQCIEDGKLIFSKRGTVLPQDFALCGILFNKKQAREIGAFENPHTLSCDTELFLQLCLRGKVGVIHEYSSIYRMHTGNLLKSVNKNPDLLEGNLEAFINPLLEAVRKGIDFKYVEEFIVNTRLKREILVSVLKIAAVNRDRAKKLISETRTRLAEVSYQVMPSNIVFTILYFTAATFVPLLILRRYFISYMKIARRFIFGRRVYFAPLNQDVYFLDETNSNLGAIRISQTLTSEISGGSFDVIKEPRVGIALATFEPEMKFFEQQIGSLISQTYKNWVCTVVDDFSSEEKFKQIEAILKKDSRFILYRNESNIGSFRSFEKAIQYLPSCEYVAFCDQDDIWKDYKLEFLTRLLKRPEISFVHSDQALIDKNGDVLAGSCWDTEGRYVPSIGTGLLLFRNTVSGCAIMFKSQILKTALPFPDIPAKQQPYYHDVWVAMHACLFGQGMAIKEPLVLYRQHDNNQVGANVPGRGLHLPTLVGRSVRLYDSRLKLRNDFVNSLRKKNQLSDGVLQSVNFTNSFWVLIYRSIHYSLPNPRFFKTGILLILGYVFSRVPGLKRKMV